MSENLEMRQRSSHLGAALAKAGRREQAAALLPEIRTTTMSPFFISH